MRRGFGTSLSGIVHFSEIRAHGVARTIVRTSRCLDEWQVIVAMQTETPSKPNVGKADVLLVANRQEWLLRTADSTGDVRIRQSIIERSRAEGIE